MQVPDTLVSTPSKSCCSGKLTNLIVEVPTLFEEVINAILGAIDTATGLDLSSLSAFLDDILTQINSTRAVADAAGFPSFHAAINLHQSEC